MVNPKDIPHDCRCEVCGKTFSEVDEKVTRMDGLLLEWTSMIEFAKDDKPGKDLETRTRKEIGYKEAPPDKDGP